ncbi:MAG: hypothetical protein ABIG44_03860 [Planctomycetota bacterium]
MCILLRRLSLMLPVLWCVAPAPSAVAGGPDIDIEDLKGSIWRSAEGWTVRLRCEVEIEDARRGDRFELVFRLTERGQTVVDGAGYPVEVVVVLDRPVKVDDDEIEFRQAVRVKLPRHYIRDPKHLRVHATVLRAGSNRALEHESKSIKYKRHPD